MAGNINPYGLKTFAEVGIQTQIYSPQNMQSQPNMMQTPNDVATFSNKPAKKGGLLKKVAIAAAIAAVVATIIYAVKQGKKPTEVKEMQQVAQTLTKEAQELIQGAGETVQAIQKKADNAFMLFRNNGLDADGKAVATITGNIMEEFAEDGTTLIRKSVFDGNNIPQTIEEFIEGSKNVISMNNGKLSTYSEGITSDNGIQKIVKRLRFKDGALSSIEQGIQEGFDKDGGFVHKAAQALFLKDGQLSKFEKGVELYSGQQGVISTTNQALNYTAGKISSCKEGAVHNIDPAQNELHKSLKSLAFDTDENPVGYAENLLEEEGSFSRLIKIEDGKWVDSAAQNTQGAENA